MTRLSEIRGLPEDVLSALAVLGVETAEQLLWQAARPGSHPDVAAALAMGDRAPDEVLAAAFDALGLPREDAAAEPPPDEAPADAPTPGVGESAGVADSVVAQTAEVREALWALSEAHWDSWQRMAGRRRLPGAATLDRNTASSYEGDTVQFDGVDPTNQYGDDNETRVLVFTGNRRDWAIEVDGVVRRAFSLLREAQRLLGWPEAPKWSVGGRFSRVDWTTSCYDYSREDLAFVIPHVFRVPGQVCVFLHPTRGPVVPGLESAVEEVARIQDQARESDPLDLTVEPHALLGVLAYAMGANDFELFGRLWVEDTGESSLRYSYRQYVKSWASCAGNIAVDRYDARNNLESWPGCGDVKLFVRRENTDGSVVTRPLTFRHDGERWRIYSGTI